MPYESFNQERIFREDIEPLIEELMAKCQEHEVPLLLFACYELDYDGEDKVVTTSRTILQGKSSRIPMSVIAAYHLAKGNSPMHHTAMQLVMAASTPVGDE